LRTILIECDITMKLVRQIKKCLNEAAIRVCVGKHSSDMFPIKNGLKLGQSLSPLLFNFAFEEAIRRGQVNQDGLKLNGTHQLLAYADGVKILEGKVHTIQIHTNTHTHTHTHTEALVFASKEIGLEVNVNKTKYMVMSRDLNAGRSHSMKTDNSSLERVEEFRYLEKNLN